MIVCSLNHASKNIYNKQILNNYSMEIKSGERVALVGPNGCGKTTLLQMIAGQEPLDEGDIHYKKGLSIGFVEQIPTVEAGKTVDALLWEAFGDLHLIAEQMREIETKMASESEENQLEKWLQQYGMLQSDFQDKGGYTMEAKINQVATGLGIHAFRKRLFYELSGGEQTKVMLAINLLNEPALLLVDEPTNHLDITAMDWLEQFLRQYGGTVVMTSHDRHFLDQVATTIYDLDDQDAPSYEGGYTHFTIEKEKRMMAQFAAYQEQQKKIKKMRAAIKRLKAWANRANPPNDGLHRRAKSMEKALEKMTKIERPKTEQDQISLSFQAGNRSGNDVIILKDVSFGFDDVLFDHVNMHIRQGDKAAIVGDNGSGKSTILKLITGDWTPKTGVVQVGSNVKLGILSQQVTFAEDYGTTVLDVFRYAAAMNEEKARHILAKFLFFGASVFKKVDALSGGERIRLKLAQLMYQNMNLLLLDEPTNHLDIESREALEEALRQYDGTVLAVSHDRYFLNRMFNKTFWLSSGALTAYPGRFSYAKEKRQSAHENTSSMEK
nr:ABC-F family ATP-binding cassette domain-containing protein [Tuberibacillus sp. Marseille-P3662]